MSRPQPLMGELITFQDRVLRRLRHWTYAALPINRSTLAPRGSGTHRDLEIVGCDRDVGEGGHNRCEHEYLSLHKIPHVSLQ